MQGKNENILTFTDKINSFEEKLTLWGARIKKGNKAEIIELTKYCRLDKNLVDLILQNLSLLSKNTENVFPVNWRIFLGLGVRSVCFKCVRVSRINCCRGRRADGCETRQKTETEALINRYGLNLVVSPTGVPHHHKVGDSSTPSFLYNVFV
jgi:hypothetical protein